MRGDSEPILRDRPPRRQPRLHRHLLGLGPRQDRNLAHARDLGIYLTHAVLPWAKSGDVLLCATGSAPDACAKALRQHPYDRAWFVPLDRADVHAAIEERFRAQLARDAAFGLARAEPRLSAQRVILAGQARVLAACVAALGLAVLLFPYETALALTIFLGIGFVANIGFRALLVWIGAAEFPQAGKHPAEDELPVYTVLVPMYREANMARHIVQSLNALEYPRHKLQVIFAVERDDDETFRALSQLELPASFEIVRVPPGQPRTKPRACNYALNFARGEFLVIYDAEDRPERDQLKKAVAAFRASGDRVACHQARLNFYNRRGWLPVMFTLDYSLWFDFLLPGLDRIGVPMPLGGTSNHLRTKVVREIHGWDPFNVTEDADLGIRLAEKGYRVSVLDSTTFEEAADALPNWLRQRSRWLKGYGQTWLVHMRDPARLIRNVGWPAFIGFQLFVGGTFASALLNPLLWMVFGISVLFGVGIFRNGDAVLVANLSLASLVAGNALFIYLAMLGLVRRGWLQFAIYALTAPVYWLLVSAAGYRGFAQLFRRPFYWEKTQHGAFAPS